MPKRPPTDNEKTTPFLRDDDAAPLPEARAVAAPEIAPHAPPPLNLQHKAGMVGGGYAAAKAAASLPGWAIPVLTGVIVAHLGGIGLSWGYSVWQVDRLGPPKDNISDIALAPPPPPPPPPPPGGQKPQTAVVTPKKPMVKELVRLTKIEKPQDKPADSGDPAGEVGGEVGGEAGGVVGGEIGGVVGAPPPPPPPPPPPAPPQNIPPTLLEGQRIAGEKMIVPNDVTKTEISRSGKDKVVGSYKLCITVDGSIASISQLKSTGFGAYDAKIQGEMRNWRYRPYMVNGKAVPVCTAVTFIYTQK